ncbi:hypothetical protein ACHHYP_13082 [Achlya hypogyna]|uniref:CRAL-TRIO domain-containing protein n=1 Tax=Achlya hypogyna TaxID=1202772 RepID=A0A1V9YG52_ACHHY|nr:hypothetical protein ACHHYP_13082 [Achlya hypogyna]
MDINLDDLLQLRAADLATLKALVGDVLGPDHDDVWLLRFLLTNNTPAASEEPIRFTIQWRRERAAVLAKIRAGAKAPMHDEILRYQVVGDHKYTARGEPLFFVRLGLCNAKSLLANVAYNDILEYMLLSRENMVAYLEAKSRAERRIVKGITVVDFAGFSVSWRGDSQLSKLMSECNQLASKMYPHMVGQTILVNAPRFVSWSLRFMKHFMDEQTMAQTVLCPGGTSIAACPYLSKYLVLEDLPTFLGGQCSCDGGCIGSVPNSQTRPLAIVDANGMATLTADARATQTIDVSVTAGHVLEYAISAPGKVVHVTIMFRSPEGTTAEILPPQDLHSAMEPVHGRWEATSDGVASILFNNKAFFSGRQVQYRTRLIPAHA